MATSCYNVVTQLYHSPRGGWFARGAVSHSPEVARATAEEEMVYTADLCEGFSAEVWITVEREETANGVGEHYSVFKRLMIGAHKL